MCKLKLLHLDREFLMNLSYCHSYSWILRPFVSACHCKAISSKRNSFKIFLPLTSWMIFSCSCRFWFKSSNQASYDLSYSQNSDSCYLIWFDFFLSGSINFYSITIYFITSLETSTRFSISITQPLREFFSCDSFVACVQYSKKDVVIYDLACSQLL